MSSTTKSSSSSKSTTTVSAPGKVLLAGGYLVLESPNTGFVVATNKRFYTTIEYIESYDAGKIVVDSPQFHSSWTYQMERVRVEEDELGVDDDDYDNGDGQEGDKKLPAAATTTSKEGYENDAFGMSTRTTIFEMIKISPSTTNKSFNPFVEKTLQVVVVYLQPPIDKVKLHVTIRADNDFYSILPHLKSSEERTFEAVSNLEPFLKCPQDENGKAIVNKTGLGSSAALTTSLVGALVYHLKPYMKDSHDGDDAFECDADDDGCNPETMKNMTKKDMWLERIHNLAQICHCHAQGKVGSGFDVSAAIHGTHIYQRFPKCLLPDLLQQLDAGNHSHDRDILAVVAEQVPWKDDMVESITLPTDNSSNSNDNSQNNSNSSDGALQILLADIRGGSESPSMARTVLKWKQQQMLKNTNSGNPRGRITHWDDLKELNRKVIDLFKSLGGSGSNTTDIDYDTRSTQLASEWPEDCPLKILHETFQQIRTHLKAMGNEAGGVPIEPDEQTKLCDATMTQVPGVIAAVVPGAGGYDAVACLYINRSSVRDAIVQLWSTWKEPTICPLSVQISLDGLQIISNDENN